MADDSSREAGTKKKHDDANEGVIRAFRAFIIVALGAAIGYFVFTTTGGTNERYEFKFGLDLAGGSHLVYEADVSAIAEDEISDSMNTLRDVIERRVNTFGVSEPIVQVEGSSIVSGERRERLVVELPGVTDVSEAIEEIGKTPLLEFKLVDAQVRVTNETIEGFESQNSNATSGAVISNVSVNGEGLGDEYIDTGLTGRFLQRATLEFGQGSHNGGLSNEPIVRVDFDAEGANLFEEITSANVGEQLAIFLDGVSISEPVIRQAIFGGTAIISGNFTPEEARDLVRNLNFGALPLPIELQSTQTIGSSLGGEVLEKGVFAGMIGLGLVMVFMLVWYRLPGLVAVIALLVYIASMLALFKLIPVTLTAAGLAGFIISIGMAVDANVLVFERMKEEYRRGNSSRTAAREGFKRAWTAIRDGNVTSILSAIVLFWFGTSIVKGFALVFGMGVLVSMITALSVTRTLLVALPETTIEEKTTLSKLFTSGFQKKVTDEM